MSGHAENPDQSANQTGNCLNHSQGSLSNKSCVHLGHYVSKCICPVRSTEMGWLLIPIASIASHFRPRNVF